MRKVIGIGETILDIIFRGDQPSAAVPGGSVFNGIVSLGRMGVNVGFISETGNDRVGNIILQFMRENNIPTDHVNVFPDGKSPVSLAFLNEQSDAEYIFYKNYPKQRLDVLFPKLEEDDGKRKPSSITTRISALLIRTKPSNWLQPLLRILNMRILYAVHWRISSICTTYRT